MAEVVAAISLVASIASLIDFSSKVISRVHEFTLKSADIPEFLCSLSVGLPVLVDVLQHVQNQARASKLSTNELNSVQALIDNTIEQVKAIRGELIRILPSEGASKLEQTKKSLKSFRRERVIQQALDKIQRNISLLSLYQTTRHSVTGDAMQRQLSEFIALSTPTSYIFGREGQLSLAEVSSDEVQVQRLPHMQSLLTNHNNADLMLRFMRLPASLQENFRVQVERQLSEFVDHEEAKFLEHLTIFDTRGRLAGHNVDRYRKSCQWLLESQEYHEWRRGNTNRLKLLGPPGSGKTFMSAFVTKALEQELKEGEILAVYLCTAAESPENTATKILCALASQIAQNSPTAMERCRKFLERHVSEGQLKSDILDLQDLIVEMSLSSDIRQIYIIIDGLDEGTWEKIDNLQVVVDIAKYARKIKMFVTSRQHPLIAEGLAEYSSLSVGYATQSDLVSFIDEELERVDRTKIPSGDFDEIRESLIRHTGQTFLAVRILLSALSDSLGDESVYYWIKDSLLGGRVCLSDIYEFIVLRIEASNDRTTAIDIKRCLLTLANNPDISSFAALNSKMAQSDLNIHFFTARELTEQAKGLLQWHSDSDRLDFAHSSMRDFVLYQPSRFES